MVKRFSDNSSNPTRALQIWQIIVGKAHSRQKMTYGELAKMIGYTVIIAVHGPLKLIEYYCVKNGLPRLNILVVDKQSGVPGEGTNTANFENELQQVFDYDWYALMPPTPEEFRQVGIIRS
jgi:putative restriction endonuclease